MFFMKFFTNDSFLILSLFINLTVSCTTPISIASSGFHPRHQHTKGHLVFTSDWNDSYVVLFHKSGLGIIPSESKKFSLPPHLPKHNHHQRGEEATDSVTFFDPFKYLMSEFKNSTSKQDYPVTSKLGKLGPNEMYTGIVREDVKYDSMSTTKGNPESNELPDSDESEEVPLVEARAFINVANFFLKLREAIKEKHEDPESSEEE